MRKKGRKKSHKVKPRSQDAVQPQESHTAKVVPGQSPASYLTQSKKALTLILVLATLIGGAISLLSLFSKVSVSSSGTLDPYHPFASPFVVSNEGTLPIKDLRFFCDVHKIVSEGADLKTSRVLLASPSPLSSMLRVGESTTMACPPLFQMGSPRSETMLGAITYADISVVIYYKSYFFPWLEEDKSQRFKAIKMPDGTFSWLPVMEPISVP